MYKYAHNQNSGSTSVINRMEEHHKVGKKKDGVVIDNKANLNMQPVMCITSLFCKR